MDLKNENDAKAKAEAQAKAKAEAKQSAADTKSAPANIPPATEFEASGAPKQAADIDVSHPAVDNDPRAGTSVASNQIDFNDPNLTMEEAVAKELGRNSGVPTKAETA